jgi:hypothetical protein
MSHALDAVTKVDAIHLLVDGLALAYHEARHVRVLTKAGHVPLDEWAALVDLPRDRVEAWKTLTPKREAAFAQVAGKGAAAIFERAFARSATDLMVLFSNPRWVDSVAVGGLAWRNVLVYVLTLRDMIDSGQRGDLGPACSRLVNAADSNGLLGDRIVELDRSVNREPYRLWTQLMAGA